MRREVVFHIGQQPGRFITGRLDYPAIERRQGRRHALMPRCLIAGLSGLFHNNEVAIWVHGDEAQATGKGLVLGPREVFLGHGHWTGVRSRFGGGESLILLGAS